MLQPAEMTLGEDITSTHHFPLNRCVMPHSFALMRPTAIIEAYILVEYLSEVIFTKDYQVIQAVSTYRADHPFAKRILPRGPVRCNHFFKPQPKSPGTEFPAVIAVPVTNQVFIPCLIFLKESINHLLCEPLPVRAIRYIGEEYPPSLMTQNNKPIKNSESCGGNASETHLQSLCDLQHPSGKHIHSYC